MLFYFFLTQMRRNFELHIIILYFFFFVKNFGSSPGLATWDILGFYWVTRIVPTVWKCVWYLRITECWSTVETRSNIFFFTNQRKIKAQLYSSKLENRQTTLAYRYPDIFSVKKKSGPVWVSLLADLTVISAVSLQWTRWPYQLTS